MDDSLAANILVVDDSGVDRKVLKHALEAVHYNVACVASAAECLSALETQTFDILLVDINMPATNGFDLLHQIKEKPHLRELPIVMMSGDPAEKRVVRSIELGAVDFLPKPFSVPVVQSRVAAILEVQRVKAAVKAKTSDTTAGEPLLKVLVVDDSPTVLKLVGKNLSRYGYEVTLADSGERALQYLNEAYTKRLVALGSDREKSGSHLAATVNQPLFDIILLDIIMPGMKGTELLQRIKAGPPSWKDIPIIVMSSLDDPDTAVQCMRLGADDVLTKPFNMEVVKTRINTRLEHVRLRSWVVSKLPALSAHAYTPMPAGPPKPLMPSPSSFTGEETSESDSPAAGYSQESMRSADWAGAGAVPIVADARLKAGATIAPPVLPFMSAGRAMINTGGLSASYNDGAAEDGAGFPVKVFTQDDVDRIVAGKLEEAERIAAMRQEKIAAKTSARTKSLEESVADLQRTVRQLNQENRQLKKQAANLYDHERELLHSLRLTKKRVQSLLSEAAFRGFIPTFYFPNPFAPRPFGQSPPPLVGPRLSYTDVYSHADTIDLLVENDEDESEYMKAVSIFEAVQTTQPQGFHKQGRIPKLCVRSSRTHVDHGVGRVLSLRTLPSVTINAASEEFQQITRDVCGYPSYFAKHLFTRICDAVAAGESGISAADFLTYWCQSHEVSLPSSDRVSKFWHLVCPKGQSYILPEHLEPLIQALIDFHPDLVKIRDDLGSRRAYVTVVLNSIFCSLHGQRSSRISYSEIKASNLVDAFYLVTSQATRHVLPFSINYFEEAIGLFVALRDMDSNGRSEGGGTASGFVSVDAILSSKETRISPYIMSRILAGIPRNLGPGADGRMSFDDFIWFWLAHKDRMADTSIVYWFRCLDADDDGYVSLEDLRYCYMKKLESQGIARGRRGKKRGSGGLATPLSDLADDYADLSLSPTCNGPAFAPSALGDFCPPLRRGTPPRCASRAVEPSGRPFSSTPKPDTYNPDFDSSFRPFVSTATAPFSVETDVGVADFANRTADDASMLPSTENFQLQSKGKTSNSVYGLMCSLLDFVNPAEAGKITPLDIKRSGAGPAVFDVLIGVQTSGARSDEK